MLLLMASCGSKSPITSGKTESGFKRLQSLQSKYSTILQVDPGAIENEKLYAFVDDWMGVKYQYGGLTKNGVDCSGFTNLLYSEVYNKKLARRAQDIYQNSTRVSRASLSEGDLVFFDIAGKKKSHIGVYLTNNRFVHASTSKGVVISDLNNSYYQKYFASGGRQ